MQKGIYISGAITDNKTGMPREGWEKAFREAEDRLRTMGFATINPVDISDEVNEEWQQWRQHALGTFGFNPHVADVSHELPTRATYVTACLNLMNVEALAGRLHGLYLIGNKDDLRNSFGVQSELLMAKMLNIPIFYEYYDDSEVSLYLFPVKGGRRLFAGGQFVKETWSTLKDRL